MVLVPSNNPEFQLLINPKTSKLRGRIYFSSLYISQNIDELKAWIKQNEIYFTQSSIKTYQDGSFRLIFEAPQSEYEKLKKWNVTTTR